jgi:uncharacterized membrane protein YobD (UPF0266 family)
MSKNSKNILGSVEWVTNVYRAIVGIFGAMLLALAYCVGQIIWAPDKVYDYVVVMLILALIAVGAFALYLVYVPWAQGVQENEQKLYFTNLGKEYRKIDEYLESEQGDILAQEIVNKVMTRVQNAQKSDRVGDSVARPDARPGDPSVPWDYVRGSSDVAPVDLPDPLDGQDQ